MRDVAYWSISFLNEVEANRPAQGIFLQALGGPSFVYRTPETTIWIDPYLSGTPDSMSDTYKATPIPINPEEIKFGDIIISTHSHIDHCHAGTILPILKNTQAFCVGPQSSVNRLKGEGVPADRMREVKVGDHFQFRDVELFVYPSYDAFEPGAVTMVLASGGVNLFVSGDTSNGPALGEIARAHPLDYALLAFGRTWYMSEPDMLATARVLNPKTLLPFHWDFWRNHTGNIANLFEHYYRDRPPFDLRILLIGDSIASANQSK
jgi:L-ascorbate metabolism protein UlaG (beta-lactamase superfamily)